MMRDISRLFFIVSIMGMLCGSAVHGSCRRTEPVSPVSASYLLK